MKHEAIQNEWDLSGKYSTFELIGWRKGHKEPFGF